MAPAWPFGLTLAVVLLTTGCSPALAQALLPDGRVYELVSPADKSGGIGGVFPLGSLTSSLEQFGRPLQSAANGSVVSYLGEDFYRSRLGSLNQYISRRGSGGWITENLTSSVQSTTESAIEANLDVGFSQDLSTEVVSASTPLSVGELGGYANLYVGHGSQLEPLITKRPPNRASETFGYANHLGEPVERSLRLAGGNSGTGSVPSFSHILFEANDALTNEALDGGQEANNLYDWSAGHLKLVNILPDGEAAPNASFGINYGDIYNTAVIPNLSRVVSADGRDIFWTDENNGNLYVRENEEHTVLVAEAAQFQTASADGSRAIFTHAGNLYQFNTASETVSELAGGGGVLGILGASDDLSYIYLVSAGALAPNADSGQPNLYVWHEGQLGFIATLSPQDDDVPSFYGTNVTYGDWYRTFAGRTAMVSANGLYVAFISIMRLTGYDNTDVRTEKSDYEVFLYDAAKGTLACTSCNTDGSPPTNRTILPAPVNGIYQQRYLNNQGRLFFSTEDAVIPQDTNGASDLYEYEEGHVYLISPGDAPDEAVFADASESGDDVFFTTRQQVCVC